MTNRIGNFWIFLIVISEIILLFLPVYIYDNNLLIILAGACLVQMWFFYRFKIEILKITKTLGLRAIPFVFAIINLTSYQNRKVKAFENNRIRKTEATITKRYSKGGYRTSIRYYLAFRFKVNSVSYEHMDEVKFWVWFYYQSHDKLYVDYVIYNPRISRINQSSLIEQPNHKELMNEVNKEFVRKREKQKK
jgi:hypothetical protein